MEGESIQNIIPSVKLSGIIGLKVYTVFITSKRLVFILSGKDYSTTGAMVGGLIGFAAGHAASWEREQYGEIDLETMLKEEKNNRAIDFENIVEIKFKKIKPDNYYNIQIYGLDHKNKNKKLINGLLIPASDDLKRNKEMRIKTKDIYFQYALECQKRIDSVLNDKISNRI